MVVPIISAIAEATEGASTQPVPASVLITAIVALCGVVAYLFRDIRKTLADERAAAAKADKAIGDERTGWAVERAKLENSKAVERAKLENSKASELAEQRADFEEKFRELIGRYDDIRRRDYEDNRRHEDQVRKDFADIMDKVSAKDGEASQAMVEMLQKLQDRLLGHR